MSFGLGLTYWGYIGIMDKKVETTIRRFYRVQGSGCAPTFFLGPTFNWVCGILHGIKQACKDLKI